MQLVPHMVVEQFIGLVLMAVLRTVNSLKILLRHPVVQSCITVQVPKIRQSLILLSLKMQLMDPVMVVEQYLAKLVIVIL